MKSDELKIHNLLSLCAHHNQNPVLNPSELILSFWPRQMTPSMVFFVRIFRRHGAICRKCPTSVLPERLSSRLWSTGNEAVRANQKACRSCKIARKSNFTKVIFLISISKLIKYSIRKKAIPAWLVVFLVWLVSQSTARDPYLTRIVLRLVIRAGRLVTCSIVQKMN